MIGFLHVTKLYKTGTGIRDLDFRIERAETVLLEGPVGAGKTTAIRLLLGLERPDTGRVIVDERAISELNREELIQHRRQFGVVSANMDLLYDRTLLENVTLPLELYGGISRKTAKRRAIDALSIVGLSGRAGQTMQVFTNGEKLRAALARAIVTEPQFLVLDEPLARIEKESADIVLHTLIEAQRAGLLLFLTAQTLDLYYPLSPRRIKLQDGRMLYDDPPAMLPQEQAPIWTELHP